MDGSRENKSPENTISYMHNIHFMASLNVTVNPSHWPTSAASGSVTPHCSSTSTLRALAVLLVALPPYAPLSRTKLGSCILQAHLLALPLVLDKIHASIIHDWCSRSAQWRYQILIMLGARPRRWVQSHCVSNLFHLQYLQ